ncbi:MAG: polysaccharide pyruvyl transferase family protein [Brevundimonas sp.]|uniref:polysaccharide pyruvyl transferase family protein n=1 Tax=Brevundimonas sp. TaxID=1871086 RepID=UPI00273658D2|nr:polysaccharide pyruvyl transferase family protein [Brevundimonas sp.]MDP3405214.1 polysaccharide pyruvyl transferase family protein [Brevundimonas sp.]
MSLWRSAAKAIDALPPRPRGPLAKVLIVASDPGAVVGSRGDDAMFSAVIQEVRRRNPEAEIGIVCVSEPLPPILVSMNVKAEPVWNGHGYGGFRARLEYYDSLIMIGADVMDGHYSGPNALRQWAFSDLAARRGLRALVLGCSFSDELAPEVIEAVGVISPRLRVYARDRMSKEKFDLVGAHAAELVADSAFLLPPSPTAPDYAAVDAWTTDQRAEGRFVCALNVHPMIHKNNDMAEVEALNQRLKAILPALSQRYPVSFLLVPHDFRDGGLGDNVALSPLYDLLKPILGDRVAFAPTPARASELKALVACADMLVTGRMHLGVGALSMGTPMWGLSYQDKFIGLFEHFGLPDQRITPEQAKDAAALEAFFVDAFDNLGAVRDRVRAALPNVKALAALNFELLDQ